MCEKKLKITESVVITVLFSSPVLAINGAVISIFPKKTGMA